MRNILRNIAKKVSNPNITGSFRFSCLALEWSKDGSGALAFDYADRMGISRLDSGFTAEEQQTYSREEQQLARSMAILLYSEIIHAEG